MIPKLVEFPIGENKSMYEIMIEDTFDAAHQLIGYNGPCENLHGHGWRVRAYVSGKELNKLGMLIDFKDIKENLKKILSEFDHNNLNTMAVFKKENPTSENLAKFIFNKLGGKMGKGLDLTKVTVFESPTSSATYFGEK